MDRPRRRLRTVLPALFAMCLPLAGVLVVRGIPWLPHRAGKPQDSPHGLHAAQSLTSFFEALRPGFRESEVRERLGPPDHTVSSGSGSMWFYWCRDGILRVEFTEGRVRAMSTTPGNGPEGIQTSHGSEAEAKP